MLIPSISLFNNLSVNNVSILHISIYANYYFFAYILISMLDHMALYILSLHNSFPVCICKQFIKSTSYLLCIDNGRRIMP